MFIKTSEKTAFVWQDADISYETLLRHICFYKTLFNGRETKKVAIFSSNRPEWAYAFLAAWKIDAIPVPIDFMAPAEEVAYILNDCRPEVVFCSAETALAMVRVRELLDYDIQVYVFEEQNYEADAYPALLQQRLLAEGYRYKVINAGIGGETTSGLRSRIDWAITLSPDIVIIETGANDALRAIDTALIKGNMEAVILILKERNIPVVLAGMRIYKNLGADHANAFENIYPDLAKVHGLIFMPFFLKGVAGNPGLNQQDGMHPTAEGYRSISKNIYPYVLEAINRLKRKQKGRAS